ncbi:MAG: type II toxin-antitoxin system Phd/YefM family antitoxin [Atopobiaceae bacterium]|nr:type II toxin-antitoxin system Phd/YefM family antitoxin [Atopobiaceae bacterium]
MPQIVPVSDFRADINSVARHTDGGEVVILTQNGRPRWAMIDYDEWNAAAQAQERAFARELMRTEERELRGELTTIEADEFRARVAARKRARERVMA